MSYFSRLTDIVTCSLTKILAEEDDPKAAIEEIIAEMQEGLAAAQRCVSTSDANAQRLQDELSEHKSKIEFWMSKAKEELGGGNDEQARLALVRKSEVENLIAGLEREYTAAVATREHLMTTQRALEARLAEARRKQAEMQSGESAAASEEAQQEQEFVSTVDDSRAKQIEDELAALKRELEQKN